jgi:hypothetical protein
MKGDWVLNVQRFLLPKEGCSRAECEDVVAINSRRRRFAIADGATEAFDSKTWAKLLVTRWVRVDPPALSIDDFQPLAHELGVWLHERWMRKSLPWYAEEKARSGSFAAFLGVQFYTAPTSFSWKAIALGDCCLIQERENKICTAFPITDSGKFGSNPILIPSLTSLQSEAFANVGVVEGTGKEGDEFFLLSDAIAAWYLRADEDSYAEKISLRSLLSSQKHDDITLLIQTLRSQRRIRNDDVTIVRIAIQVE